LFTLLLPGFAAAQTTGGLEGYVVDPAGATVPGVSIALREVDTNLTRTHRTNPSGRYEAAGLPPGSYRVQISHPGFRTYISEGIAIGPGRSLRIDFPLQIGETADKVVVTTEAPLVSPSTSDWGQAVTGTKMRALPLNGRDLYDLAAQETGATYTSTALSGMIYGMGLHLSVNGSRPMQNAFRMDGIYINDASGSSPGSSSGALLGIEAVQEIRLVTSPFSAEYGRSTGGVLSAVTKSGTNQLHGSVYEFFRNSSLDAKNYFDAPNQKIPPLRRNQFGGLLSGPLRKDRLFLLGNYEGTRRSIGTTVRPLTLTANAREGRLPDRTVAVSPLIRPYLALYPLPNGRDFGDGSAEYVQALVRKDREDYATVKSDWLHSERIRVSGRYTYDRGVTSEPDQFRIWDLGSNSSYQFASLETSFLQSSEILHTFRAGYSRVGNVDAASALVEIPAGLNFVPNRGLGSLNTSGLYEIGESRFRQRPKRQITNDYQLNWDSSFTRTVRTWKMGGGVIRHQFNQQSDLNPNGSYQFDSIADMLQVRARQGDLMAPGSDTSRGWRQTQYYAYLQGEFRLSRRLQLTLGVRHEAFTTPTEVNNRIATLPNPYTDTRTTVGGELFDNPSRDNLAPRAALAWDPFGDGKTVVRAGFGIFFDLIGSRELLVAGVRLPPFYVRLRPRSPAFPNLFAAAQTATASLDVETIDYYLPQPYVIQQQFAIERQLGRHTALQVSYAGSRGVHLAGRISGYNHPVPRFLADGTPVFAATAPRMNPAFGQISMRTTQFNSFFHALHLGIRSQVSSRLRLQAKYTWGKSIDESSSPSNAEFAQSDRVPTVLNYRENRGPSDFDIRHVMAMNASYSLGTASGANAVVKSIIGGWELHGMARLQSGPHFSPYIGLDNANLSGGSGQGQRPNLIAAPGSRIILGDPQQWFDPKAFAIPAAGQLGNLGRNALEGPGLAMVDLALHKSLWKSERHNVSLRTEVFNSFNRPNFQIPLALEVFSNTGVLGSAGRLTQTTTTARQIQLALKWAF